MKPAIVMIAAIDQETRLIGNKGKLIHRVKEDLQRFAGLTKRGIAVIMGRKTVESLPNGSLAGREIWALSGNSATRAIVDSERQGVRWVSRADVDSLIKNYDKQERRGHVIYVAGGEQVYREFMPVADALEITEIRQPGLRREGDAVFPVIDPEVWELTIFSPWYVSPSADNAEYRFLTYTRKEPK